MPEQIGANGVLEWRVEEVLPRKSWAAAPVGAERAAATSGGKHATHFTYMLPSDR